MNIGHIEILVSNPLEAKLFYTDILGFEEVIIQQNQFVWLKMGGIEILLRPNDKKTTLVEHGDSPISIVFYTDDLPKRKRDLEDKGVIFKGYDGSIKCPTFTDEDGNWFQLVNPNDH